MRRAERADDHWSGHWSFPGGRRDGNDEDLLATALRELHEECGVSLERSDLEMPLKPMTARRRTGPFLVVAPFVFKLESAMDAVPDLMEAVETRWFPLDILRDPREHRVTGIPKVPDGMLFPCIPLPEMPLWGFTYRLITEWLNLLPAPVERPGVMQRLCDSLAGLDPDTAIQRLNEPWNEVPPVNMVEVQSDGLRISGLDFEDYRISLNSPSTS